MNTIPAQSVAALLLLSVAACGTHAFSPHQPGSSLVDVSSELSRVEWLDAHPDADDDIRQAIREGVFLPGMTPEHVEVISNPERAGVAGLAYWRHFARGEEVRYRWYVSGKRTPFLDGREQRVCELVFRSDRLLRIRYCGADEDAAPEAPGDGAP